jgi:hypothetical protein
MIVAGALLVLAPLLRANPWFGSADQNWPWNANRPAPDALRDANWILWGLLGIWALVLGVVGARRVRAPVALALAFVLLVNCHSGQAGLVVNQIFTWTTALAALFGGFLALPSVPDDPLSPRPSALPARLLAGLGALGLLWILAVSFDAEPGGPIEARLPRVVSDAVDRVLHGPLPGMKETYDEILAQTGCFLVAALLGLAVAAGLTARIVGTIGLCLLLLGWLIPTFAHFGRVPLHEYSATLVARVLSEALIDAGLALAVVTGVALADIQDAPEPAW